LQGRGRGRIRLPRLADRADITRPVPAIPLSDRISGRLVSPDPRCGKANLSACESLRAESTSEPSYVCYLPLLCLPTPFDPPCLSVSLSLDYQVRLWGSDLVTSANLRHSLFNPIFMCCEDPEVCCDRASDFPVAAPRTFQ